MQLSRLTLKNFRSCSSTEVEFAEDLTVFVGENASGKTGIIDALRLSTYPATGRRTAWFSPDRDLTRTADDGSLISIQTRFTKLSEAEEAIFMAGLVDEHGDLVYTTSFATDASIPSRNAQSYSVGESQIEDPEPANRRRIAHVYLPPLRDAVRDLDGGEGTQLHEVLRTLLDGDKDQEDTFKEAANTALSTIAAHALPQSAQQEIQRHFSDAAPPSRNHTIQIKTRVQELRRLVGMLRLQFAETGVDVADVASSGLGYANLLYISMIVLQLSKARENDLTLLLVEEPEAHLHPQLQAVLLDYLRRRAQESGDFTDELRPAGKVQIIVTTHSPNLASSVSIKNIAVVARQQLQADPKAWCTQVTPLWRLGLDEPETRKIDRYLTVTRASLLFARRVVLVEGIAEALLVPEFAKHYIFKKPSPADATTSDELTKLAEQQRQSLRQFHSSSIVIVEGVDFEPYLKLLLTGANRRADKVVVITDADNNEAGNLRKQTYEKQFSQAHADGVLSIHVGTSTLEADLFASVSNEQAMKAAFLRLHTRSEHKWTAVSEASKEMGQNERAKRFSQAIRADKSQPGGYELDISKGDFAHLVAEILQDETRPEHASFQVPAYLDAAIRSVTAD